MPSVGPPLSTKRGNFRLTIYLTYHQVFSLGVPASLLQKQSSYPFLKHFPGQTPYRCTVLVELWSVPDCHLLPLGDRERLSHEKCQSSENNACLILCPHCRTTSLWTNYGGNCLLIRLNTALLEWHPTTAATPYPVPWTTCPSPQRSMAKVTFNFFLSHHTLPPLSPVQHTLLSLCKAASAPLFFVFPCFASDNRSHF